eukprot:CAMPEP_0117423758 /NCGR_PEP_ID=MMETSP0758-20121206/4309_1 /TAXON_ID=63605 /ORGANISM="Percolomonas cosmopolitus, Strain AE-1 (ATCC 50343)" /LENGTH=606 /DNA_ID=CAMNT_0005207121 /DNA_START=195 /DNA_END=2011 /DNA_ORIENTATION=-
MGFQLDATQKSNFGDNPKSPIRLGKSVKQKMQRDAASKKKRIKYKQLYRKQFNTNGEAEEEVYEVDPAIEKAKSRTLSLDELKVALRGPQEYEVSYDVSEPFAGLKNFKSNPNEVAPVVLSSYEADENLRELPSTVRTVSMAQKMLSKHQKEKPVYKPAVPLTAPTSRRQNIPKSLRNPKVKSMKTQEKEHRGTSVADYKYSGKKRATKKFGSTEVQSSLHPALLDSKKPIRSPPKKARVVKASRMLRPGEAPNSPVKNIQETDPFVENILGIEKRVRLASRKGKRRRSSAVTDPIVEDSDSDTEDNYTPQDRDPSKPVLFDGLDPQEPLKLQYDPSQVKMNPGMMGSSNPTTIQDFKMMAAACNRSGKSRQEGLAHYNLASLYEGKSQMKKAVAHYRSFLRICQTLKDEVGMSLALNRLGVLFQGFKGRENMKTALEYHIRHWEIADTQSKIVAHINMGLIFQNGQKDPENAGEHFRLAFQYALGIGDKHGESIALQNLGALGKQTGDTVTAQACIERHLLLSETMNDDRSSSDAYQQLGMLHSENGNPAQALTMLDRARQIAVISNEQSKADQIKCSMGIVKGNAQFDELMKKVGDQLRRDIYG